jgi:hypothetical protein
MECIRENLPLLHYCNDEVTCNCSYIYVGNSLGKIKKNNLCNSELQVSTQNTTRFNLSDAEQSSYMLVVLKAALPGLYSPFKETLLYLKSVLSRHEMCTEYDAKI